MLEHLWKAILRRGKFSLMNIPAFFLWLASFAYRAGSRIKRFTVLKQIKVPIPVVSVGNISVGGSGKTPVVGLLAKELQRLNIRVGISISGYGRKSNKPFLGAGRDLAILRAGDIGDEALLLANQLPDTMIAVDSSKAVSADILAHSGNVDVILVDDGFQHWKLHRDLDIVLFDTSTGPRFLNIFPYGVLREPMASLKRAHVIILTRSQGNDDILVKDINQFTSAEIYRAQFDFSALVNSTQRFPVSHLSSKSVSLFAGIGNFTAFTKQVTPLTRKLDFALELADHQQYSIALLRKIRSMAERFNSDCLVTTYKDWVKFGSFDFGRETYYLDLKVELDPPVNQLAMSICDILKLGRKSD